MLKIIGVRFKSVGKIYYFDPKDYDVKMGDKVICLLYTSPSPRDTR